MQESSPQSYNWHEIVRTIGTLITVVVSLINLIYAIKIFHYKDKKEDAQKQKDIRAAAFKNLILDQTSERLFAYFKNVESELLKLRQSDIDTSEKQRINQYMIDQSAEIRREFVDSMRAVSDNLYDQILRYLDRMSDSFTNDIFNEDIDLSNHAIFDARISNCLSSTRTNILRSLIAYDGTEDELPATGLSILPPIKPKLFVSK